MINRGMDIRELVNSQLFFPLIWQKYTLFATTKDSIILPYNNDIEDLEFEDPNLICYQ